MATPPAEVSSPSPPPLRPAALDTRALVRLVGQLRRAVSATAESLRADGTTAAASLCAELGLPASLATSDTRLGEELDAVALLTGRMDAALLQTAWNRLGAQLGHEAWFLPLMTRLIALPPTVWRVEPSADRRWAVESLIAPEPVTRSVGQILSADAWLDVDRVTTRLVFGWNLRHLHDVMLVVASFDDEPALVEALERLAGDIDPLDQPLRYRERALEPIVRAMAREQGQRLPAATAPAAPSTSETGPAAASATATPNRTSNGSSARPELPDTALDALPRYEALVELVQGDDDGLAARPLDALELDSNTERRLHKALDTLDRGTDTLSDLPARANALLEVKGFGQGTLESVTDALHAAVSDAKGDEPS